MDNEALETETPAPPLLTPEERDFAIRALTEGVNLQGTYAALVPTMNLIESIIRKLSGLSVT